MSKQSICVLNIEIFISNSFVCWKCLGPSGTKAENKMGKSCKQKTNQSICLCCFCLIHIDLRVFCDNAKKKKSISIVIYKGVVLSFHEYFNLAIWMSFFHLSSFLNHVWLIHKTTRLTIILEIIWKLWVQHAQAKASAARRYAGQNTLADSINMKVQRHGWAGGLYQWKVSSTLQIFHRMSKWEEKYCAF